MNKTMLQSREIYLEADGKKLAAVQQYRVRAKREALRIDAIGSEEAVGLVSGKTEYELELKKVLLRPGMDVDLFELSDFSVLIAKPGHHLLYSGCEWKEIEESLTLGEPCYERMLLSAKKRMVLEAEG